MGPHRMLDGVASDDVFLVGVLKWIRRGQRLAVDVKEFFTESSR